MIKHLKRLSVWTLAVLAVLWAVRQFDLRTMSQVFDQLNPAKIGFLLLLNGFIFFLFALRWWIYVRGSGGSVPLHSLIRYRLTSFGITYFTPGPQMGGEPYQVYALSNKSGISADVAVSSVSMDKLTELIANFSFLVFGAAAVFIGGYFPRDFNLVLLPVASLLLLLPSIYLILVWRGRKPLFGLMNLLKIGHKENASGQENNPQNFFLRNIKTGQLLIAQTRSRGLPVINSIEKNLNLILRDRPIVFIAGLLLTFLTWLLLIGEYHLALRYLGFPLSLSQTIVVLTAARFAFLLPAPSGLGTLEASQVIAMQALGFGPAAGIGISLLIRGRDVLFGATGLVLAGKIYR